MDGVGSPILPQQLASLTLTICDTLSSTVINGVERQSILNVGRGSLGADGVLTITLRAGDTFMDEVPGEPSVQRSLVIDWTYNGGASTGRLQVDFIVVSLAGL